MESGFELEVSYSENLPQHDGQFHVNGLSVLKMSKEISPAAFMDNWISIFPNPTGSTLFIQSKEVENTKFVVRNVQGQRTGKGVIINTITEVDVSHLTPGIYIIKVVSDNKSCVKQFVKQ